MDYAQFDAQLRTMDPRTRRGFIDSFYARTQTLPPTSLEDALGAATILYNHGFYWHGHRLCDKALRQFPQRSEARAEYEQGLLHKSHQILDTVPSWLPPGHELHGFGLGLLMSHHEPIPPGKTPLDYCWVVFTDPWCQGKVTEWEGLPVRYKQMGRVRLDSI